MQLWSLGSILNKKEMLFYQTFNRSGIIMEEQRFPELTENCARLGKIFTPLFFNLKIIIVLGKRLAGIDIIITF